MLAEQTRDIYRLGGWILKDGTILPRKGTHTDMAVAVGYSDFWSATQDGAIAVLRAPTHHFNSALFIRVHVLDAETKSRLKDFIAAVPSELAHVGIFIEWAVGAKRGGEAFCTVEEALDWLDRIFTPAIDCGTF